MIRSLLIMGIVSTSAQVMAAAPSHFATKVGPALLCLDDVDSPFFYDYLSRFFGPPAKYDQDVYWFGTKGGKIWGATVDQVMVARAYGIGADIQVTPEKLVESITKQTGIHFSPRPGPAGTEYVSAMQSHIKPFGSKTDPNPRAMIYCVSPHLLSKP